LASNRSPWLRCQRVFGGSDTGFREFSMMIKKIALATIAVVTMTLPLAYAGDTSSNTVGMTHPSATDLKGLTDARVSLIKAALQLTPDQQQYWPAVEQAIRDKAT